MSLICGFSSVCVHGIRAQKESEKNEDETLEKTWTDYGRILGRISNPFDKSLEVVEHGLILEAYDPDDPEAVPRPNDEL